MYILKRRTIYQDTKEIITAPFLKKKKINTGNLINNKLQRKLLEKINQNTFWPYCYRFSGK